MDLATCQSSDSVYRFPSSCCTRCTQTLDNTTCFRHPAVEYAWYKLLVARATCEDKSKQPNKHFYHFYNAFKCNLTELTTRSTSFTCMVIGLLYMRMCQHSSCSWSIGHCSVLLGVLVSVFLVLAFSPERGDSLEAVSPPLSLPFFPLFYQCDGYLFFFSFCVGAHGWVAWICQPWEQSPSRSWLPTVEAPGCLRQPTSILRGSC